MGSSKKYQPKKNDGPEKVVVKKNKSIQPTMSGFNSVMKKTSIEEGKEIKEEEVKLLKE